MPGITTFHDSYGHTYGNLAHAPTDELLEAFTEILCQRSRNSPL
jgi:hypothetical protein